MSREIVVEKLKCQSTWCLLFLSVVTLGIYTAHYLKSRTRIMNRHLDEKHRIPEVLTDLILGFSYGAVILLHSRVLAPQGHPDETTMGVVMTILAGLVLVWGFEFRNRMNRLLGRTGYESERFHSLWTFLFSALYFNFKINMLNRDADIDDSLSDTLYADFQPR